MSGVEIVGLVLNASDVSLRVMSAAVAYGKKVKGAAQQSEAIRGEIQDVSEMLKSLHMRAKEARTSNDALEEWPSLKDIDRKGSPLRQIRQELNVLLDLLSTKKISKIEHLLWPRKLKKAEKSLQLITQQKEVLMQRMTVDTGFQTIKTDRKISELAQHSQVIALKQNIKSLSDNDHTIYHREALKERMDSTGEWFNELSEFARWKNEKSGILWICGSAGSGKTVLSSTIINSISLHCENKDSVIAYFYFKDGQRHQAHDMLRSVIKQLCIKSPALSNDAVSQIQRCCNAGERPNDEQLVGLLRPIAEGTGKLYIVIDALDECVERKHVIKLLAAMAALKLQNLHLLVTSRDLVDIRRILEPVIDAEIPIGSARKDKERHSRKQRLKGIQKDIALYVERSLTEQHYLNLRNDEIKGKIREKLVDQADGMFRWVSCQIDQLSEPLSDEDLLEALDHLPKDLDETYERMLRTVLSRKNEHAQAKMVQNLLKWMVATTKPLSIEEATEAVFQSYDNYSLHKRLPSLDAILEICAGLVKSVKRRKYTAVEFVHFSVKEYLLSERITSSKVSLFAIDEEAAYREITKLCISYIFLFDQSNIIATEVEKTHPFLLYACRNWGQHLQYNNVYEDAAVMALVNKFLDINRQRFHIMSRALTFQLNFVRRAYTFSDLQLYDAIKCGLNVIAESLLQRGVDPNSGNYPIGYALHIAIEKDNMELVELLIRFKANVNLEAEEYDTPLALACRKGNLNIINTLLNKGANPNPAYGSHPLQEACERGRKNVVQLLLDKGVSKEAREKAILISMERKSVEIFDILVGCTNNNTLLITNLPSNALLKACSVGNALVVRRLIEAGTDINHRYPVSEESALYLAVEVNDENIVCLLLNKGADAKQIVKSGESILQFAASKGNAKIVEDLIANGANPNFSPGIEGTALGQAVLGNHLSAAKVLLEHDADKHAPLKEGLSSAFFYALYYHKIDLVKLFIKHGIDLEREGGKYGECVVSAITGGHDEIVKLLVGNESRTKLLEGCFGHVLVGAAAVGDEELVRSCLDVGDDVNMVMEGRSPLHIAVMHNRMTVVELLLNRGADVNLTTDEMDNALHDAALFGFKKMCALLIDRGAPVNRIQGEFGTPFKAAIVNDNFEVVDLLIERGADVNLSEGNHGHPLEVLLPRNHGVSIIRSLLGHGADPNVRGGEYGSVLQAACYDENDLNVECLLETEVDLDYAGGSHPSPVEILHNRRKEHLVQRLLIRGAVVPPSLEGKIYRRPNSPF